MYKRGPAGPVWVWQTKGYGLFFRQTSYSKKGQRAFGSLEMG